MMEISHLHSVFIHTQKKKTKNPPKNPQKTQKNTPKPKPQTKQNQTQLSPFSREKQ